MKKRTPDLSELYVQTVRELWNIAERAWTNGDSMLALKIIELICHVIKGAPKC